MGSSVSMLSAKLPSIISSLHFFAGQENPGIPSASLCITVDGCQDASSIDDRPPVVAGFFCVDQSSIADLLLVTAANVEAFRLSRQQRVSTFSTPVKIIAAEYAPRSSLGPVVALSSAEGRILIMNAVTFEILKSIFLRQTDLSVLNPGESLQNKAKLRATFLLIPMNNVLLAGLSNGQVSIFFLDSGVCVRQLLAPGLSGSTSSSRRVAQSILFCFQILLRLLILSTLYRRRMKLEYLALLLMTSVSVSSLATSGVKN